MAQKHLNAEIVRPGLYEFAMNMPDPDHEPNMHSRADYGTLLRDARIAGDVRLRIAGTTGLGWQIVGGAEHVNAFVRDALQAIPLHQDFRELLSAIIYGFSVSEILWHLHAGRWVPQALKSRSVALFSFDAKHRLVWQSPTGPRVLPMPHKFIVHRNSPHAESPYGTSSLRPCWWLYKFKKAGWQYWLQLADRYGVPSVLALFDLDTTDPEETKARSEQIAQDLHRLKSDSAGSFANVREVKTIDASGRIADFNTLIAACNAEISYAITGQVLATQEAKHGTRAQAEVHERAFDKIVRDDARALSETINKSLIRSLVDLNFGVQNEYPHLVFDTAKKASFEEILQAVDRGVPISLSALYEHHALPKPKDDADIFLGGHSPSSAQFSHPPSVFF